MTREEAAKHFEKYIGNECYTTFHQDACRMAVAALRAQQTPAKLDRSRWEGCAYCTLRKVPRMPWHSPGVVVREGEYREGDNSLSHIEECSLDGSPETRTAWLVTSCEDGGDHTIEIRFCPICGRPLTEEAWAELERRLTVPPNDPIPLEELREMDGEPVFCFSKRAEEDSAYGIACIRDDVPYVRTIQNKGTSSRFFYLTTYGTAWLAYHRKPEEVKT